jgi:hypothetical protein
MRGKTLVLLRRPGDDAMTDGPRSFHPRGPYLSLVAPSIELVMKLYHMCDSVHLRYICI